SSDLQQYAADSRQKLRFRAGTYWQPAIGRSSGDRESRFSVYQMTANTLPALSEISELPGIVNRRSPSAQKIRPYAQAVVCVREVVDWQSLPPEYLLGGLTLHRKIRDRTGDRRRCTEG